MRISAKGRYALASAIHMAGEYETGVLITVSSISDKLGISKIYLEQVFSLLKRGGLVTSLKGAQGGYLLARAPRDITVYDVLSAVELSLFESAEHTVAEKAPHIDGVIRDLVFKPLDLAIQSALQNITIKDLVLESEKRRGKGLMFYI